MKIFFEVGVYLRGVTYQHFIRRPYAVGERRAWSFREGVLNPPGLVLIPVPVNHRAKCPIRTGLT